MTREQIEQIVDAGAPFTIFMADGKEYHIPHRDYIWLPPAKAMFVAVYDDTDHITILPLRTVTGLKAKAPRDPHP